MKPITRPDGLQYTVAEQPQPGIATFANAEVMLLHDQRPVPDEIARAIILVKQVFPGARVEKAKSSCPI